MPCPRRPFGDVSAEEYLQYARDDLSAQGEASLINALGNAKRCMDYQVNRLLFRYALWKPEDKAHLPEKIELLEEFGILSGRLLRRFNRERNAMEHGFSTPTKDTVEGAMELCDLLLLSTERLLDETPLTIRLKYRSDARDLLWLLEPGASSIRKFRVNGASLTRRGPCPYYSDSIYDLRVTESRRLAPGMSLFELWDESIQTTPSKKTEWGPVIALFVHAVRNQRVEGPPTGDEPFVEIRHRMPLSELKEALGLDEI